MITGAFISVIGLGYILFKSNGDTAGSVGGDLLVVSYVIVNSLIVVWGRKVLSNKKKYQLLPEHLAVIEYTVCSVSLLLICFVLYGRGELEIQNIGIQTIIIAAVIGTFLGALPLLLYYRSVRTLSASRLADTSFISAFVAVISGVFFLGEELTVSIIIGGMALIIGLFISHDKIHPVMLAHQLYVEENILLAALRQPKKAYVYITRYTNTFL